MWTIAVKEFRELLYSAKFVLLFAVSTALILISIFNGYAAYSTELRSAELGKSIAVKDAAGTGNFTALERTGLRVTREPQKLSIFNQGISGVIGKKSTVRSGERPRARDSRYSLDPILAVFGELDVTFTVSIILSLFALLFAYNSVSGERESGTLLQIMSNSTKRSSVILGKLIGGFFPLALIFFLPFLIGIAALLYSTGINFSGDEWLTITGMAGISLLYLLAFYVIGLAMSALTRNSFVSFLLCLFVWVVSVVIVPKVAVQTAAQVNPSMSIDELESKILAYKQSTREEFPKRMNKFFADNTIDPKADPTGFQMKMQEGFETVRQDLVKEEEEQQEKYFNEYAARRDSMMAAASGFAKVSPTSCFSLAMHAMANTGPGLLESFESDLVDYRPIFVDYVRHQEAEASRKEQAQRDTSISVGGGGGRFVMKFGAGAQGDDLDLANMPKFQATLSGAAKAGEEVIPDFAILSLYAIAFFSLAFVAFLRYDVRL